MKGILNNYVAKLRRSRAGRLRTLTVLFLLSAIVASSVVWGLRIVGMSMSRAADTEHYLPHASPVDKTAPKSAPLAKKSGGGANISPSPSPTAA